MPELPEVETIARGLRRRLAGRRILACRHISPHLLPGKGRGDIPAVAGQRLGEFRRRGKYLIVDFHNGTFLAFHLRMTGQLLVCGPDAPRDRHTHLILRLDRREELRFRDVRKFGVMRLFRAGDQEGPLQGLGPEPLEINRDDFEELLGRRTGRLKSLLLNQRFLAGIGNIYADEILFEARLHPLRPASSLRPGEARRLWVAMRRVLRRAVRRGGSTIRDYADSEGRLGRFQLEHKVYGRDGKPCRRCGRAVRRQVIGGRSSHFCPRCQPEKVWPRLGFRV